jgi:NADPH:quinone reductase-like Zn-dependent oxidoreductase
MKAIVYHEFGSADVLRHEDIEKPTPGDNEVLIRVRAASANPLDWRLMRGKPYPVRWMLGLRTLKRSGRDVAGQVEAVGRSVTGFKPGEEVFGTCSGSFAEYACAPESGLALKPENVSFEQAASSPVAGLTALQGLRDKGRIQPGKKVLINGAAGGVGTFAVQIAKSFGADVTGVCSTRNVEMVRSIGAGQVIDYTREDFTKSGQRYDLLLDCVGNHPLEACKRVLSPHGIFVMVGVPHDVGMMDLMTRMMAGLVSSWFDSRKTVMFIARSSREDLTTLGELMKVGKVTPVLDRRQGLQEVPQAIRHLEEGHARGKIVVTV